ncbi:MAG: EamA family transporter [Deltaproteobacteria bacterium HGW-Deltaproteobacteria-6]|nr:MAG: EamA family transporter [Deltaproteobacteria bacterium HGW-Deltaproteobacteria-6]
MQWSIVLLILLAAALHAGWNVLIKAESGNSSNTILIIAGSAVIGVVFLPFVPLPLAASWPYLGASVVIHIFYFGVLLAAYKKGDMSLVYPLMRGLPPVLTALAASVLFQESLSPAGWMGVALVSAGALTLMADFRLSEKFKAAPVLLAIGEAAIIVIYTLVDARGARLSGHAFSYTGWMLSLLALFFLVAMPVMEGRQVFVRIIKNWKKSLIGGSFTFASYGIALWAMTYAPVALVAALREASILFGTIFSVLILKERVTPVRILSIIMIVAGAVAIKMS